jgi:vacuolar protein sorting-associated protein 13A/C
LEFNEISNIILKSFIKETKLQIYKILGSSDIIGNPVKLVEKIGTGFFEFVNEYRKGLLKGPTQFGKGLAKRVAGLLNGVVGGALESVSKISGTLYSLLQTLTGKNNEIIMDEESEPSNIITGASEDLKDGFQELYIGFAGLIFNPIERTSNSDSNPIKFFKDLGLGLVGFAVSPVNFVLKIGNSLAVGTKNTFNYFYNKSIKNQRFRFPRYIQENNKLEIYDPDLSAAKEFLYKLIKIENPIILFFSIFM